MIVLFCWGIVKLICLWGRGGSWIRRLGGNDKGGDDETETAWATICPSYLWAIGLGQSVFLFSFFVAGVFVVSFGFGSVLAFWAAVSVDLVSVDFVSVVLLAAVLPWL